MIVDFTVENFRSFKNQEILSAEAGERLPNIMRLIR